MGTLGGMHPQAAYIPRLGRLPAADIRDLAHPMRAAPLAAGTWDKPARYWSSDEVDAEGDYQLRLVLDQGQTGTCVGHAWAHWEQAMRERPGHPDPFDVYREAVMVDEWPDNDHEGTADRSALQFGTSVRAGAKALQGQGLLTSYSWAWTLTDVVHAVLNLGPVVFGSWWYDSMMTTAADGRITVGGNPVGGHAYLIDGIDTRTLLLRVHNSWDDWGKGGNGYGYLSFEDAARLLGEQGEACLGVPTAA